MIPEKFNSHQKKQIGYLGNPNVKDDSIELEYSREEVEEYLKCQNDPLYFIENYVKIITLDYGLSPFELRPYQKEMVKTVLESNKTVIVTARQMGKCVSYDTVIKLRNKKTKEIFEISIGDFFEMIKSSSR